MSDLDPRLEGALEYARRGWPVFPVGENKLPAVKKWESVATTDEAQIAAWFGDIFLGGCNFGFTPGRAGIAVIDLDVEKKIKQPDGSSKTANGEKTLAEFEAEHHERLPETYSVRTPSGGLHLYYHATDLRSKNHFLDAVDVKSCGGYVLVPGSRGAKGAYSAIGSPDRVAELPPWFLGLYGHRKSVKEKPEMSYNTQITPDTEDKLERARQIIEEWPEAVEGERNDQLFQLMRELCKAGVSRKRAIELYAEEALDKIGLDPDSAEVTATIRSAYGDLSDLGAESQEGRHLAVRMFDDLPELPAEEKSGARRFSDNGGMDWLDLAERPVPPRRWFIENWLSADEGYTVLFSGRGGTGKSALMLDLMYALAVGGSFCGMPVLRGAKTMFLSCEDSEEEIARRIQKRNIDHASIPRGVLRVWPRLGQNNILCVPDKRGVLQETSFMAELRERGKAFFGTGGGVLILDTLSDIFAGDENNRSQVSQFVKQHLNRLGMELGVTIVVLAHPAKGASLSGQGFSGSTAWEGAFRCRWELNHKDPAKIDGLLELILAKSNTAKAGSKIALENRAGMFLVVDGAKADDGAKQELVRLIAEAYEEGNPFGLTAQAARPIAKVKICDPITGIPFSEKEIKTFVSELLAEARVETFRNNKQRGLKPGEKGEEK